MSLPPENICLPPRPSGGRTASIRSNSTASAARKSSMRTNWSTSASPGSSPCRACFSRPTGSPSPPRPPRSAARASRPARATPPAIPTRRSWLNLTVLRHGLSYLGIAVSFAALTGILAACRAIRDDVAAMRGLPVRDRTGQPLFPRVASEGSANALGMTCALSVPFMLAGVWIWAGKLGGLLTWTGLAATAAITLGFVFFRISKTGRKLVAAS